jgi:hypothetical protein
MEIKIAVAIGIPDVCAFRSLEKLRERGRQRMHRLVAIHAVGNDLECASLEIAIGSTIHRNLDNDSVDYVIFELARLSIRFP